MSHGVTLEGAPWWAGDDSQHDPLFAEAAAAAGDLGAALALARRLGRDTPRPGQGGTAQYFETMATAAAADVTVARVIEPHLDALAILAECPSPVDLGAVGADAQSTWGVFAAEGPGVRLDAVSEAGGWRLEGTKPWCSLAGSLSHALVTAHLGTDRRLFAVALRQQGVTAHPEAWVARGFPDVPSGPTDFRSVPAVPVGESGWYLERPGFAWGGIGVAAAWFGGAVGVGRRVVDAAEMRGDDLSALAAGRVATSLTAARAALAAAARTIDGAPTTAAQLGERGARSAVSTTEGAARAAGADAGATPRGSSLPADADGASGRSTRDAADRALLAQVTRSVVRQACDDVLREAAYALGPAAQALDAAYAARVADLSLYLLQDHGDRDSARIGRLIVEGRR